MKEQIVQTERQSRQHRKGEVRASCKSFSRATAWTERTSPTRLWGLPSLTGREEQLPIRTLKGVVPPTVRVWRTA